MIIRKLTPEPQRRPTALCVWPVTHPHEETDQFVRQGLGIREILQAVEDALVDDGYYDFLVATRNGSFHWMKGPDWRAQN
jgi:hypothetical protein